MTNIRSIAGSAVWMLISGLLFFAALEPVSVEDGGRMEVAAAASQEASA